MQPSCVGAYTHVQVRVQHCDTDQERRSVLWSHLGEEVRQELNCLLDVDTSDPRGFCERFAGVKGRGGASHRSWVPSRPLDRGRANRRGLSHIALEKLSTSYRLAKGKQMISSTAAASCEITSQKAFRTQFFAGSCERG